MLSNAEECNYDNKKCVFHIYIYTDVNESCEEPITVCEKEILCLFLFSTEEENHPGLE